MENESNHYPPCGESDADIRVGGDVSGVTVMKETLGVVFLGLLALFLAVALQRAYSRNQELWFQLLEQSRYRL